MNDIIEVSEDRIAKYDIFKSPGASFIAIEKKWFVSADDKLIGIISQDRIDHDYHYLVLGQDSDNVYRAIDGGVVESIHKAEFILLDLLRDTLKEGKKEEFLFEINAEQTIDLLKPKVTNINDEIKKYLNKHPHRLYDLEPRKFEELVASIMEDLGFSVELTKATRDGGRDIIASIKTGVLDFLTYVECKRYSPNNKIDVGIIRQVLGVHAINKPAKSMIVTTSFFSKDAVWAAKNFEHQLELKDYNHIKEWLKNY